MSKLINTLELIKKYQRPIRTLIWTLLIILSYLNCLYSSKPCPEGFIIQTILIAMFVDMGIYTISRTFEKNKNIDNNGN